MLSTQCAFRFAVFMIFLTSLSVRADPVDPISTGVQLAQIDFSVVNNRLVEKCNNAFPETVPALVDAIAQWNSKNADALKELRQMNIDTLMKVLHLSAADAAIRAKQQSAFLTEGLKRQFDSVYGDQLKDACAGQYASKSLQDPSLNFRLLLTKIKK